MVCCPVGSTSCQAVHGTGCLQHQRNLSAELSILLPIGKMALLNSTSEINKSDTIEKFCVCNA